MEAVGQVQIGLAADLTEVDRIGVQGVVVGVGGSVLGGQRHAVGLAGRRGRVEPDLVVVGGAAVGVQLGAVEAVVEVGALLVVGVGHLGEAVVADGGLQRVDQAAFERVGLTAAA